MDLICDISSTWILLNNFLKFNLSFCLLRILVDLWSTTSWTERFAVLKSSDTFFLFRIYSFEIVVDPYKLIPYMVKWIHYWKKKNCGKFTTVTLSANCVSYLLFCVNFYLEMSIFHIDENELTKIKTKEKRYMQFSLQKNDLQELKKKKKTNFLRKKTESLKFSEKWIEILKTHCKKSFLQSDKWETLFSLV